jgi:hypothetical protein
MPHYYDVLGLVRPTRRPAAGHRSYGCGDLLRLQRVLAYRALGCRGARSGCCPAIGRRSAGGSLPPARPAHRAGGGGAAATDGGREDDGGTADGNPAHPAGDVRGLRRRGPGAAWQTGETALGRHRGVRGAQLRTSAYGQGDWRRSRPRGRTSSSAWARRTCRARPTAALGQWMRRTRRSASTPAAGITRAAATCIAAWAGCTPRMSASARTMNGGPPGSRPACGVRSAPTRHGTRRAESTGRPPAWRPGPAQAEERLG